MTRRVFLLSGLAIMAVVLNHAAEHGLESMFWWTDRYRSVSMIPNYDEIGTLRYYILVAIMTFTSAAVPIFLFVSGFFVAYAARSEQNRLGWPMVRNRIANLLIPYVIWSCIVIFLEWAETCLRGCKLDPPFTYLARLVTGQTRSEYWYVFVLCQFILMAPILVAFAKKNWKLLLVTSAVIQISAQTLLYLSRIQAIVLPPVLVFLTEPSLFFGTLFYFVLGIIIGLYLQKVKQFLARIKWALAVAAVVSVVLAFIENNLLFARFRIFVVYISVPMTLYTIALILSFLAFERLEMPLSAMLSQLSLRSYGLYLMHPIVMTYMARFIYHVAPALLGFQLILLLILFVSGIGIPISCMWLISKTRTRPMYRYIFG